RLHELFSVSVYQSAAFPAKRCPSRAAGDTEHTQSRALLRAVGSALRPVRHRRWNVSRGEQFRIHDSITDLADADGPSLRLYLRTTVAKGSGCLSLLRRYLGSSSAALHHPQSGPGRFRRSDLFHREFLFRLWYPAILSGTVTAARHAHRPTRQRLRRRTPSQRSRSGQPVRDYRDLAL